MKKKILSMALCIAMLATIAVTGTLAYFTDTEDDINVFTLGNVKIDLVEEQRDGNGGLTEFEDNKVLLPIVGSAQGEKEIVGGYNLPKAENWVDKIVTVDNEGTQDAYVRVLFAFPAKMDADSAADMLMHWNYDGNEPDDTWDRTGGNVQVTLDNEVYNVYNFTYVPVLTKKDTDGATTTYPAINGVYIDSRVNATVAEDGAITYSMKDDKGNVIGSATYAEGTAPKIYVLTQGVQAAGFDDADTALTAGFGEVDATNAQTWFNAVTGNNVTTGDNGDRTDIG